MKWSSAPKILLAGIMMLVVLFGGTLSSFAEREGRADAGGSYLQTDEGYVTELNGIWYLDWQETRIPLLRIPFLGCAGEQMVPGGEFQEGVVQVLFRTSVAGDGWIIESVRLVCR